MERPMFGVPPHKTIISLHGTINYAEKEKPQPTLCKNRIAAAFCQYFFYSAMFFE